jgi:hypothetical protein
MKSSAVFGLLKAFERAKQLWRSRNLSNSPNLRHNLRPLIKTATETLDTYKLHTFYSTMNFTLFSFNAGVLLSLMTSLKDTEESQWYSPPLQGVSIYPLRKPGVMPAETIVASPEDLETFLEQEEDGRLTVVKYHAEWYVIIVFELRAVGYLSPLLCANTFVLHHRCKSCARFNLHMGKIMSQTADLAHKSTGKLERKGQIRFASVEWGANTELSENEGVETLPTTRFYFDGKLVEEITGGTKNMPRVKEVVAYYTQKQQQRSSEEDLESTLNKGNALVVGLMQQTIPNPVVRIVSNTNNKKAWVGV